MRQRRRVVTLRERIVAAAMRASVEGDRETLGLLAGAAMALNGGRMPRTAHEAEALGMWTETTVLDPERACPEA